MGNGRSYITVEGPTLSARPSADMSADEADSFNLAHKAAKEVLQMSRGNVWFGSDNTPPPLNLTNYSLLNFTVVSRRGA
jgi:hypothetical protein